MNDHLLRFDGRRPEAHDSAMNGLRAWNERWATDTRRIVAEEGKREGALLPILHRIQASFGCVPPECVPLIADGLNLSKAEVHGVISFYHDFQRAQPDKPVLKLCGAEACQARGSSVLAAHACKDVRVTVETVYCLGLCASGPAALIGERVVARLDAPTLDRLIDEVAS